MTGQGHDPIERSEFRHGAVRRARISRDEHTALEGQSEDGGHGDARSGGIGRWPARREGLGECRVSQGAGREEGLGSGRVGEGRLVVGPGLGPGLVGCLVWEGEHFQ